MHRRIWIKQVVVTGTGLLFIPACKNDNGAVSVSLKNISVTAKGELLIAEVADVIIPATDTPGTKALNLHQFVLKMVDDCCDKPTQEKFIAGLKKFNSFSKQAAGDGFKALGEEKKIALLRDINRINSVDEEIKTFLAQTRKFVIRGYETSGFVLTKLPHSLMPGHFPGCVKIDKVV